MRDAASLARTLRLAPSVERVYVDVEAPKSLRSIPDDPFLELQWNLRNLQDPGIDANVVPVWEAGLSGAGVVVGVVETQNVQFAHPDLEANYNADASLVDRPFHQHTTAVAGIIAMVGNNQGGGAGASYGAQFSTMAVGSATKTAEAFAYRNDLNDIKNNSWGPPDNARIGRITTIEREALAEAVANGRAGLGEVFVWAAGNGGLNPDEREDYDPYASSRYTIAVSSFNDDGRFSEYAERGSSILVCAPSDGGFGSPQNRGIFSTDLVGSPGYDPGDYTDSFGGTSAAAPLAAGVIALLLEARPDLTWRDVQHILVRSARMIDESDPGWEFNGAGRMLHERYGFGAIDAGAALTIAQDWQTIGDERTAASGLITLNQAIPDNDPAGLTQTVEIPESFRVESVELALTSPGPLSAISMSASPRPRGRKRSSPSSATATSTTAISTGSSRARATGARTRRGSGPSASRTAQRATCTPGRTSSFVSTAATSRSAAPTSARRWTRHIPPTTIPTGCSTRPTSSGSSICSRPATCERI